MTWHILHRIAGPGDDEPKDKIVRCWCCDVKVFADEANEWEEGVELCDMCFAVKCQMPSEDSVTCWCCDGQYPSDYMVEGYILGPVCEKCDIELSKPKEEDGQ